MLVAFWNLEVVSLEGVVANSLSLRRWYEVVEVFVLVEGHRTVKKNFETEMWVDGQKLPLNHFVQETVANVLLGFSKTLKGLDVAPERIEVKIKKLAKPVEVDAHMYP
jgi:hypothetical protein